jgi:hypothetical protein
MILAPTGSAAALLNGSTYHSILKINITRDKRAIAGNEHSAMAFVKARLDGVDYIFLDEVSMLSCHDLYKISAQIAKARNIMDVPFGGINIIFAGDFAQLPPLEEIAFMLVLLELLLIHHKQQEVSNQLLAKLYGIK